MKRIGLVQIGYGTVGGAVIEQVIDHHQWWKDALGLDIAVMAVGGRSGTQVASGEDGFTPDELQQILHDRREGSAAEGGDALGSVLPDLVGRRSTVVLDAAAGEQTTDDLVQALQLGAGVVLSNKAPLALPSADSRTTALWSETGATGRLRYEATCGAGLPVISTLRSLLDTGDSVLEISGTVSGTFGAIFSQVGAGVPFSQAVRQAKAQGYTEPDPRDDLSGLDVARKGLILARTMGEQLDLEDIAVHSLVPEHLADVSVDEFLHGLSDGDLEIGNRAKEALATDTSLKYLVEWKPGEGVSVGLRQVQRSTVLGALQGPENIVSFRTRRYDQYPCVVSGPGAGAAVTAAGMVADMLSLARQFPA
jgi:homoserine dehydrogenase